MRFPEGAGVGFGVRVEVGGLEEGAESGFGFELGTEHGPDEHPLVHDKGIVTPQA